MDNDDVRGSFAEKIKMLTCLKLWSYKMHAFTFLKLYTETIGQVRNLLSKLNLLIQPKTQNADGEHNATL